MEEYFSVERDAENEIVIERSRFITYVSPCDSEKTARAFIEKIRKLNSLATHNCYAYVCEKGAIKRFSDDGEPSGTAGVPILEAITGANLVDVCVVVTRYFGGIKLGAGGLVRAYSKCASSAIKVAGICKYLLCAIKKICVGYEKFSKVNQVLQSAGAKIVFVEYFAQVEITFAVKKADEENVFEGLKEALSGSVDIKNLEEKFIIL